MRNKRNNRLILGITQDDIPMIRNQMNKHRQNLGWRPSDEKQKEKKKLQIETRLTSQSWKTKEPKDNDIQIQEWCPKDDESKEQMNKLR